MTKDDRDPLRAAFEDFQCAPADVVPMKKSTRTWDLRALHNETIEVQFYESDDNGDVTGVEVTRIIVTRPVLHPNDERRYTNE